MAFNSSIEWTECTWNPVTGCTKISEGCRNCYAERMAKRLQAMGVESYRKGFELACHDRLVDLPLKWKKSRLVFTNSMSDLFHKDVPADFISSVFATMCKADWHRFQVLTKRSKRLRDIASLLPWPSNVWMGVTVENADCKYRIDDLRKTPAQIKFLSCEPLIGSLGKLNLRGIDWVIVGGESGPGARFMDKAWVLEIRDQCEEAGVPFFFKQWGGTRKKQAGRKLEGREWNQMPELAVA